MPKNLTDNEIVKALNTALGMEHISIYCANIENKVQTIKVLDIIDLINRLQADNERLKEENENLRDSLAKKKFKDELFEMTLGEYKAEAYKECMARVEDRLSHRLDPELFPYIKDVLRDELEKMVGEDNEKT